MKKFYAFLSCLLLMTISSRVYAADFYIFKHTVVGYLTCVNNGETTTMEFPFSIISSDEETKTGTAAVGYYSGYFGEIDYTEYGTDTWGYRNALVGEVHVPSTITVDDYTYTVTTISSCAFGFQSAFEDMQLSSVVLPETITEIESNAFVRSPLVSIDIPKSIQTIGTQAFIGCANMATVNLYDVDEGVYAEGWNGMTIEKNAFKDCTSLTSVDNLLANSISVGDLAFYGCTGITSIYVEADSQDPGYAIELGINPFAFCPNIESINFETENYTTIDDETNAIFGKGHIFELGQSYKEENALVVGCKNTPILPGWMYNVVASYAFAGCIGLTSAPIGASTVYIGAHAFDGCTSLSSLDLPDAMTQIFQYAFNGCTALSDVNLGKETAIIEQYAFSNCTNIKSITLPDELDQLTSGVFKGCTSLTSVVIPASILESYSGNSALGSNTFEDCTSLQNVIYYGDTPLSYNARQNAQGGIFKNANIANATLYVPKGCAETFGNANVWKKFGAIVEMEDFDVTVSSAGLATMYVDCPLRLPEDDNLLGVFYGKNVDDNTLIMGKITDIVPANTGVIVMANPGTYTFSWRWTENEVENNVITGVLEDTPKADVMSENGYSQILTLGQGNKGSFIGFYNYTGTTLGANKAFIGLTEGSGVNALRMAFEDGTETGIESLRVNDNADKGVYDLSGRRVSNPVKGLYIVNGKKVLKK